MNHHWGRNLRVGLDHRVFVKNMRTLVIKKNWIQVMQIVKENLNTRAITG